MVCSDRLIRFAKIATTISAAWTLLVCFSMIGWQTWTWASKGIWPSVLLSDIVDQLRSADDAVYVTASIDKSKSIGASDLLDATLSVPAIVILLLAAAMIIGFHSWLQRIERRKI